MFPKRPGAFLIGALSCLPVTVGEHARRIFVLEIISAPFPSLPRYSNLIHQNLWQYLIFELASPINFTGEYYLLAPVATSTLASPDALSSLSLGLFAPNWRSFKDISARSYLGGPSSRWVAVFVASGNGT